MFALAQITGVWVGHIPVAEVSERSAMYPWSQPLEPLWDRDPCQEKRAASQEAERTVITILPSVSGILMTGIQKKTCLTPSRQPQVVATPMPRPQSEFRL